MLIKPSSDQNTPSATSDAKKKPSSELFEIVERNSPPNGTFGVKLPKGDILLFRNYVTPDERAGLRAEARMFADAIQVLADTKSPELKEYTDLSKDTLLRCRLLGSLSEEYDVMGFLYIAKRNPVLFEEIVGLVDQACLGNEKAIYNLGVDAGKKE